MPSLYKLLIVDDEAVERKALRMIIDNQIKGIHIVGEAENGRKAIELAETNRPDLILMDIKMPGIDGVEAVKRIKQTLPDTHFIMVSAFDTFEYAREVMQQGVKEYLLKPTHKDEIINAVRRVLLEIASERHRKEEQKRLRSRLQQAINLVQSEWVISLLMDHVGEKSMGEWSEIFDFKVEAASVVVFSFHDEGPRLTEDLRKKKYQSLKWNLEQLDEQILIGPMTGLKVPALVINPTMTQEELAEQMSQMIHTIEINTNGLSIYAGLGPIQFKLSDIPLSYRQALIALEQLGPENRVGFYSDKHYNIDEKTFINHSQQDILNALKYGDEKQGEKGIMEFFQKAQEFFGLNEAKWQQSVNNLYILIKNVAQNMGMTTELSPILGDFSSFVEWKRQWVEQFLQLKSQIIDWHELDISETMQAAKHHIDENYHLKSLSLEETSEQVGLSPYYFSKLFKETFNVNYIDYLTGLRIEKAKEQIMDPKYSLKEICFNVGYKDPNYFSRVFKKIVGMSPSDFRKENNNKKVKMITKE